MSDWIDDLAQALINNNKNGMTPEESAAKIWDALHPENKEEQEETPEETPAEKFKRLIADE